MKNTEKMTLSDWIASVGLHGYQIAEKAGVTTKFVKTATRGVNGPPMALPGIEKILDVLSQEHGRIVTLDMVADLNVA
jgi:hypothetical protein